MPEAEAEAEIAAEIDWYKEPGLGAEFLAEVAIAIRSLDAPGPECKRVTGIDAELVIKRKLVRRFPYLVIFVEFDRSVRVIAVAHGSREPNYWRDRLRG